MESLSLFGRVRAAVLFTSLAAFPLVGVAQQSGPPDMGWFAPKMQTFPLYGDAEIPNSKPAADEETPGNGSFIRKVSRPAINVHLPSRAKATGAAVVIFPGGGYAGLTFDFEGTQQANYFTDHGVAAFVVKYRIPDDRTMVDKSKGPLQDAQQAMRVVRERAAEWIIDPKRIGVIGFSAGGHLASTLATHYAEALVPNPDNVNLRPDFLVLVYPVITMDEKVTHMDSRKALLGTSPSAEMVRYFSSELQVTRDTPPTLLLHAADDRLVDVDNSILFFEAMRKAGAPVEARLFEKGQHGFFLMSRDRWQGAILEWLTTNRWLGPRPD